MNNLYIEKLNVPHVYFGKLINSRKLFSSKKQREEKTSVSNFWWFANIQILIDWGGRLGLHNNKISCQLFLRLEQKLSKLTNMNQMQLMKII